MTRRRWAALAILFVLTTALAYLIFRVSPIFVVVLAFLVGAPIALYRARRRMPRLAALGIGLAWVFVVGVIWVIPAILGPTELCTYADPTDCPQSGQVGDWQSDRFIWPRSIYGIFPVTYARVGRNQESQCHERYVEWWMGAISNTECWIDN